MDPFNLKLTVVAVPRSQILANPDNFNNTNHGFAILPSALQLIEAPCTPQRYALSHLQTRHSYWYPILSTLTSTQPKSIYPGGAIALTRSACAILKPAVETGMYLGRVPLPFKEDVYDLLIPLLRPYFPAAADPKPSYFFRLDECSSKDGVGRVGPFSDPETLILSLTTSSRAFKTFRHVLESPELKGEVMHLIPWRDDINTNNEFRVFVPPSGRIGAISQYTERVAGWDVDCTQRFSDIVPKILLCNAELRRLAAVHGVPLPADGYVLDVHVKRYDGQWKVEPIELNPFGAQMSSGSGLFSWLEDWETMYARGEEGEVELRIVAPG